MPDRTSQLLLSALSRAASAMPAGLPLHPVRGNPGLFPATAAGKQAAGRCTAEGYLRPAATSVAVPTIGSETTTSRPAKTPPELFVLTDKGLSFLLAQTSPRPVLEDFVRVLEARHVQANELLTAARQMLSELSAFRMVAERVLERVREPGYVWSADSDEADATTTPEWETLLLNHLNQRQQSSGNEEDCPLPELFHRVRDAAPALTLGCFHDALRQLNDDGRIYLHPWTGPLYELPEPMYALLVGHMVAYYASVRKQNAECRMQNAG